MKKGEKRVKMFQNRKRNSALRVLYSLNECRGRGGLAPGTHSLSLIHHPLGYIADVMFY